MLIHELALIPPGDTSKFAWRTLAQFRNLDRLVQQIVDLHNLPKAYRSNARKQAQQLRSCIIQASEYFEAAGSVTMSTKPLLLYYGTLSLALAEILLKGTGLDSLDSARGQHAHHGLLFQQPRDPSQLSALNEAATALRAVPMRKEGGLGFGTFELWHRVAREQPLAGRIELRMPNGLRQTSSSLLLVSSDVRMPAVPDNGFTFLDCLLAHPRMHSVLIHNNLFSRTVRSSVRVIETAEDNSIAMTYTVQKSHPENISTLYPKIKFSSGWASRIEIDEFDSGCIMRWKMYPGDMPYSSFPNAIQERAEEFHSVIDIESLNEFGIFYYGLFIIGNYARYYPERWMKDVESSSALAMAARSFTELAEERLPILALSELSRAAYMFD